MVIKPIQNDYKQKQIEKFLVIISKVVILTPQLSSYNTSVVELDATDLLLFVFWTTKLLPV
jgi:hypothetical protein